MRYLKCPYCEAFRPAYEKKCLNENCNKQAMRSEGFFTRNFRWPRKREVRRLRFLKQVKSLACFPRLSQEGDAA